MNPCDRHLRALELSSSRSVHYYSLPALEEACGKPLSRMPFSLKILLESLMRMQEHPAFSASHVEQFCKWEPNQTERKEFPYMPSRVLLQDFTGVPCIVDLGALRSALARTGRDSSAIEPQIPVDLIIDHSVQVDAYGEKPAFETNLAKEFERNRERYTFLHWGQAAFKKLNVFPPGLGICHQVNMEYLAQCVSELEHSDGRAIAYSDTH